MKFNKTLIIFIITLLICVFTFGSADARKRKKQIIIPEPKPPVLTDFEYRLPIITQEKAPFYKFELNKEIYMFAKSPQLADIRIFNKSGQSIPFEIQKQKSTEQIKQKEVTLNFFPLYDNEIKKDSDLSMQVIKNNEGTIVSIKSINPPENTGLVKRISAYLVDAKNIYEAITTLSFSWDQTEDSFLRSITIEASSDLKNWYPITHNQALAKLNYAQQQLEQNQISVYIEPEQYLKLTWKESDKDFNLKNILAKTKTHVVNEPKKQKLTVKALHRNNSFYFYTGGFFPVESIKFTLPENNTLVNVLLSSGLDNEHLFTTVFQGLLYQIKYEDSGIVSNQINTYLNTDPFYKLALTQKEGGLGLGLPEMQFTYTPEQIIFVAQGEPPYTLAIGNNKIDFAQNTNLNQINLKKDTIALASLGFPQKTTKPKPEPKKTEIKVTPSKNIETTTTRQIILFVCLGLGVVLLGLMAMKLIRQLSKADD